MGYQYGDRNQQRKKILKKSRNTNVVTNRNVRELMEKSFDCVVHGADLASEVLVL